MLPLKDAGVKKTIYTVGAFLAIFMVEPAAEDSLGSMPSLPTLLLSANILK